MRNFPLSPRSLAALLAGLYALVLAGCGGSSDETASSDFPPQDITPEMEQHFASFKHIPAELQRALNEGEITQEEYDARVAELPLFFQFKTPEDIPADLVWEDGMDLEEFADPNAKKGGTLYAAIQDFPRTTRLVGPDSNGSFRPFLQDDVVMQFARRHPNDTSIGPNGFHYYPGIAKEWAADKANKTVYIRIHPDARWSDGVPITSDDVMFTFFFYQSPHIKAPWYNNWYSTNYTQVTRYDEKTFSITLPEVRPDFLGRALEIEPKPAHFYRELGPDFPERYQWRIQPTSGAYTVRPEDIVKGRSITLTRVKDWWARDLKFWRGRYNPDRIRFTVVRDTAKAFEMFKKGELDQFGMNLAEYWYDKLPDTDPDVQAGYIQKNVFYNDIPRPTYGLWINRSRHLLDNRDIRIGINYATNWDLVIEKFARGDWTRMDTTADGFGEFTHPTLKARPFDIEKAREHFARAGFTTVGGDGVLTNAAGERLSFTITTGYEALKDIPAILREEALKCGLEFRIEVLDGTAAWKKAQEKKHDIMFSAFGVFPEMYPRYWETWHSANAYDKAFLPDGSPNPERKVKTQTNNFCILADPEIDRLIDAYDRSDDAEEMKKLAWRLEELIHADGCFVPGFVIPFYRNATWRWIRNPEGFNVKISDSWIQYFLFWIDEDMKKETREARRAGKTFPVGIHVYDQFKAN